MAEWVFEPRIPSPAREIMSCRICKARFGSDQRGRGFTRSNRRADSHSHSLNVSQDKRSGYKRLLHTKIAFSSPMVTLNYARFTTGDLLPSSHLGESVRQRGTQTLLSRSPRSPASSTTCRVDTPSLILKEVHTQKGGGPYSQFPRQLYMLPVGPCN